MILYVNGDSHTAAAEAVSPAAFAEDDGYPELGRQPHPANLQASWGQQLANRLNATLVCDAESAASNARILRTTRDWIENLVPWESALAVIQWSTWEREEWFHDGIWHQVNASGLDHVPTELEQRYRQYIIDIDHHACTRESHNNIWEFHQYLNSKGVKHLFFNGNSTFSDLAVQMVPDCRDWNNCYIGPYTRELSYNSVLLANGFPHVTSKNGHFGKTAHCFCGKYLLQYIKQHQLLELDEIPTD